MVSLMRLLPRSSFFKKGVILDVALTIHFSAAFTKRWFLPIWLISEAVMRFAWSGVGRCLGMALSEVHMASMIAFLR